MLPSVFISYAHEDRALASWITVELQQIGVKVFRDQERLRIGDLLPSALEEAVANADVFVLIGTSDGLASEWTRREFLWAVHSERRICPIYPHGIPETAAWPELRDVLAIDARASLAPIVEGTIKAISGCDGNAATLGTELYRKNVDLQLCAELLRGIAAAVQRHMPTNTWLEDISLENCFLWTATSGAPPLADTHVFITPIGAKEISNFGVDQLSQMPTSRRMRVDALRKSFSAIGQQLLQVALGGAPTQSESPSEAFARIRSQVDAMDHKRLFNFLYLIYDLSQNTKTEGLPALLDHIQQQCIYGESPNSVHLKEFTSLFISPVRIQEPSLSVVVVTHAANEAITVCLESIARQTREADEVVLIEDTPYTRIDDLEARFRLDHHLCLPASRTGLARRARCRRVGTAISHCDVVLYLDGDTVLGPGVIKEVAAWWLERQGLEESLSLLVPDIEIQPPESIDALTYEWVAETLERSVGPLPGLSSFSGAGILRSWHDSAALSQSSRKEFRDSLSWRNVRSRCWSVTRRDVLEVGNWDDAYEGWGTEETDLAYRLHFQKGMRVRMLSRQGAYAVHIGHTFDYETRAREHARNEALLIQKFPALTSERMALATRIGIAGLVRQFIETEPDS